MRPFMCKPHIINIGLHETSCKITLAYHKHYPTDWMSKAWSSYWKEPVHYPN